MNTRAEINSTRAGQGHADDAHKSPERLEQEVNQTRARIEDRLVSLTHRLSPGELLDQALGMAREHGGEFGHNLGTRVKANPVPLILTGVGLAWLMMGSKSSNGGSSQTKYARGSEYAGDSEYTAYAGSAEYAGEYPRGYQSPGSAEPGVLDTAKEAFGGISDKAHGLSDRAHEAADRVGERAHGATERAQHLKDSLEGRVHRASEQLHERSRHVRERVHSSQEKLIDFFREQPILAGGLGIALGAALGALLPPTETEDRLMGRTSADTVDKAKAAASDKFAGVRDKARETAKGAVDTLKENMQELKENVKTAAAQQAASSDAGSQQGSGSPYAAAPENTAQNNPSAF